MDHDVVFCSWDNKKTDEVAARSEREIERAVSPSLPALPLLLFPCPTPLSACSAGLSLEKCGGCRPSTRPTNHLLDHSNKTKHL